VALGSTPLSRRLGNGGHHHLFKSQSFDDPLAAGQGRMRSLGLALMFAHVRHGPTRTTAAGSGPSAVLVALLVGVVALFRDENLA
jgi:hypothetical protein